MTQYAKCGLDAFMSTIAFHQGRQGSLIDMLKQSWMIGNAGQIALGFPVCLPKIC